MVIEIKSMKLENFKGTKQGTYDFGKKTSITGANGVGKSTIADAFYWVMFGKMADGTSADKIRPHDADGKDIDFVDISVEIVMNVDGREKTFKKVQKQKWTKPHGESGKRFDGNVNSFEIDGFPIKEKEYKNVIGEMISEDVFTFSTCAAAFFKLDNKNRRKKLFDLVPDFSDDDVVASNPEFTSLKGIFIEHSMEEHLAKYTKALSEFKEKKAGIPIRIDEQEKTRVDIDVAELELQKNGIQEEIEKLKKQLTDTDKQFEEKQTKSDGIMQLKFDISDYERNANYDLFEKRKKLRIQIDDYQIAKKDFDSDQEAAKQQIESLERGIAISDSQRHKLGEQYKAEKAKQFDDSAWVFDDSSTVCKMCGQTYPQDKIEQIRGEFEARKVSAKDNFDKSKVEKLKQLIADGTELKAQIDDAKKTIAELSKPKEFVSEVDIEKLQAELDQLPSKVSLESDAEYKKLLQKLEVMEQEMMECNSFADDRANCQDKIDSLKTELMEVETKIASADNSQIDERVSELIAEEKELACQITSLDGKIDLLKRFDRARCHMLTEKVNKHFKHIKWKLFEPQINGGWKEVCIPTIGGTNYGNGLNHGGMILVDLDIVQTMQTVNNVNVPIFLDDSESIDGWRIPETESQLIIIRRTDDKELKVEVEK